MCERVNDSNLSEVEGFNEIVKQNSSVHVKLTVKRKEWVLLHLAGFGRVKFLRFSETFGCCVGRYQIKSVD